MSCNNCKNETQQEEYEIDIHSIIDDIWIDILFFLNGFDFISMNQTCKYFYKLTCESSVENSKYHIRIKEHFAIITKHQYINIQERISTINDELAEARPALEAAIKSVQNISKKQLDCIRALKKPPMLIAMTLEAACILLKKRCRDWREIRKHMSKPCFIIDLIQFDTTTVTSKMIKILEKKHLSNEKFTYEHVNRSSRACGPIAQWVITQVKFAHLLENVEPMRKEIQMCQHQLDQNKAKYFQR